MRTKSTVKAPSSGKYKAKLVALKLLNPLLISHFHHFAKCFLSSCYRPNGHRYTGGWQNGKQHGIGKLFKNGEQRTYNWEAGKRMAEITENGSMETPMTPTEKTAY